jgi:enoyl-CoA hydratase/carnithine racemase
MRVATVAAVEGDAVGSGLVLAAACDLRLCTPNARFGVPIAKTVGNCLSMANYARLIAAFGAARTKALLLTADLIAADEARAMGFVTAVVEPAAFDALLDALCARLATHAPITIQVTKEAIRRIVSRPLAEDDDLLSHAYGSSDFHVGVAAFMEKRVPRWEGR